jgi:hypothetical protein
MWPPRKGDFSIKVTLRPEEARSRALLRPLTPPPMTTARCSASTRIGSNGSSSLALPTAAATNLAALDVALSGWAWVTQLTCSRMLACSYRYWFTPARASTDRKVSSWRRGEQAATTTRFRPSFSMSSRINCCPGSEHMNMLVRAHTTPGSSATLSATCWTSTTSEMLPPQ